MLRRFRFSLLTLLLTTLFTASMWALSKRYDSWVLLRSFQCVIESPLCSAMSEDGRRALLVMRRSHLYKWDIENPNRDFSFSDDYSRWPVWTCAAFSPADNSVAILNVERQIQIRNSETGVLVRAFDCPLSRTLTFSPDGKHLLLGCVDGTVREYDPTAGKELRVLGTSKYEEDEITRLLLGNDSVVDLTYSRDGSIAARTFRGAVRIWNVQNKESVATRQTSSAARYEPDGPDSAQRLAFSPEGLLLITGRARPSSMFSPIRLCLPGSVRSFRFARCSQRTGHV